MRSGDVELGLRQMHEAYLKKPDASHVTSLGIAYLWAGEYEKAFEHFQRSMLTFRHSMSGFYGMGGVAKWCLNEPQLAIEQWVSGLTAQYADGAGGVSLPLLLFVASVLRPESYSQVDAQRLLIDKVKDARIGYWPGPLAQFVLGQFDEAMALSQCVGWNDHGSRGREWLLRFYIGILEFRSGNIANFKLSMKTAADTSGPEWLDKNIYPRRLWNEEFFIARHMVTESAQSGPKSD
jgi:lipoprotein NlpI